MPEGGREVWRTGVHGIERIFDAFRARPFGIAVFLASATLLLYMQIETHGAIRAEAVARGQQIDHPARVASFVTKVYVRTGERVEAGTPLVELSSYFIDRELVQLDAEVEKLIHEATLAQARLVVEEQRWLAPSLRLGPDRPSLERPTEALYAKEIAVLQIRRRQLLEDRSGLTIKSNHAGRVVQVSAPGAAVAAGGSVASLTPEFASEIVAYVPSSTQPESIAVGASVRIARPGRACAGSAAVLRRGAAVEEAPRQLQGILSLPVHGMPVYISIPAGCNLGIGQTLTVEFARSVM
jgi:multidrug resistance efflux pump